MNLVENLVDAWNHQAMNAYWTAAKVHRTGFMTEEENKRLGEKFQAAKEQLNFWQAQQALDTPTIKAVK